MTFAYDIKTEILKVSRTFVPAMLGMSILLGVFNAPKWSVADVTSKVMPSFLMGALMCALGLIAYFIGLWTTNQSQNQIFGWLAGLGSGLVGIAFMLWFFANPTN